MLKQHKARVFAIAAGTVVAACVVVGGGLMLGTTSGREPSRPAAARVGTGTPLSASVTAADAEKAVQSLTVEVPPGAVLSSKLVTWADVEQARGADEIVAGLAPNDVVWAVSIQGGFTPAFGRGQTFDWGVVLIDGQTGRVRGTFAGNKAEVTPFYDSLIDRQAAA